MTMFNLTSTGEDVNCLIESTSCMFVYCLSMLHVFEYEMFCASCTHTLMHTCLNCR